jgi:hypothetical protein
LESSTPQGVTASQPRKLSGLLKPSFLVKTLQHFNQSLPLLHLLRERALRAIGIVLHAKIFVDLEQTLLVCDRFQKFSPSQIISEKTCRSCFEASIG